MFVFPENFAFFDFLKHPFWDLPFCLIIDELWVVFKTPSKISYSVFFFLKKSEQLKAIILQDPEYAYKNFVEEGLDKNEIWKAFSS